jgi:hypothetical protein
MFSRKWPTQRALTSPSTDTTTLEGPAPRIPTEATRLCCGGTGRVSSVPGTQPSRIRFGPSTRSLVKRRPPSTGTPQEACQRADDTERAGQPTWRWSDTAAQHRRRLSEPLEGFRHAEFALPGTHPGDVGAGDDCGALCRGLSVTRTAVVRSSWFLSHKQQRTERRPRGAHRLPRLRGGRRRP